MTVTIYRGDCRDSLRLLVPDKSVQCVVTSPPYDDLRAYGGYVFDFESIAREIPAQMPEWLAGDLIRTWSNPGGLILDPFGGAGTVGVAAKRLGRDAVLCELNPEYCAMAEKRIAEDKG